MPIVIPVHLAVEDSLSEIVARRIIRQSKKAYHIGDCFGLNGNTYLKQKVAGFNNAAKSTPFLLLTDLDKVPCAPQLISKWLPYAKHPNLIFRVAVHEIEAWVMADRDAFSRYLGIKLIELPSDLDQVPDPKQFLINLVRKCRYRYLREAIVPNDDGARIGPDYNGKLGYFVESRWSVFRALKHSLSLKKAFAEIKNFSPKWTV